MASAAQAIVQAWAFLASSARWQKSIAWAGKPREPSPPAHVSAEKKMGKFKNKDDNHMQEKWGNKTHKIRLGQ